MNVRRIKRPSPAFVVAMIALFVGLGGTAGAVATQAVPLAKRALVAENAKKLGGQTAGAAQRGRRQGCAGRGAGARPGEHGVRARRRSRPRPRPIGPGRRSTQFSVACDAGQKVIGGGCRRRTQSSIVRLVSVERHDLELFLGKPRANGPRERDRLRHLSQVGGGEKRPPARLRSRAGGRGLVRA